MAYKEARELTGIGACSLLGNKYLGRYLWGFPIVCLNLPAINEMNIVLLLFVSRGSCHGCSLLVDAVSHSHMPLAGIMAVYFPSF